MKFIYAYGNSIDEITRKTCHTHRTVKKYLEDEFSLSNGYYANRYSDKFAPYEKEVLELMAQGITYVKIHELISVKGYTGSMHPCECSSKRSCSI